MIFFWVLVSITCAQTLNIDLHTNTIPIVWKSPQSKLECESYASCKLTYLIDHYDMSGCISTPHYSLLGGLIPLADKMDLPRPQRNLVTNKKRNATFRYLMIANNMRDRLPFNWNACWSPFQCFWQLASPWCFRDHSNDFHNFSMMFQRRST